MRDNFITTPIIITMKIIINENVIPYLLCYVIRACCVCARDSLSNTKVKRAAFAIPWFSYNWLTNISGPQLVELVKFRAARRTQSRARNLWFGIGKSNFENFHRPIARNNSIRCVHRPTIAPENVSVWTKFIEIIHIVDVKVFDNSISHSVRSVNWKWNSNGGKFQLHSVADFEYQCEHWRQIHSYFTRSSKWSRFHYVNLNVESLNEMHGHAREKRTSENAINVKYDKFSLLGALSRALTGLVLFHCSKLCEFPPTIRNIQIAEGTEQCHKNFFFPALGNRWKIWRERRAHVLTTKCHMSPMPDKRKANAFNGGNLCDSICDCVNRLLNVKSHISHDASAHQCYLRKTKLTTATYFLTLTFIRLIRALISRLLHSSRIVCFVFVCPLECVREVLQKRLY